MKNKMQVFLKEIKSILAQIQSDSKKITKNNHFGAQLDKTEKSLSILFSEENQNLSEIDSDFQILLSHINHQEKKSELVLKIWNIIKIFSKEKIGFAYRLLLASFVQHYDNLPELPH